MCRTGERFFYFDCFVEFSSCLLGHHCRRHMSVDGCDGCLSGVARLIIFVLSHGIAVEQVEWNILFVDYIFHGFGFLGTTM